MNTLSRADTAQLFDDEINYHTLRRHWSSLMGSEQRHALTAAHHLVYLALLGRDWRRAFTMPRNARKLANGGMYGAGLFRAAGRVRSSGDPEPLLAPFDGLVTLAVLQRLRARLPDVWPFA